MDNRRKYIRISTVLPVEFCILDENGKKAFMTQGYYCVGSYPKWVEKDKKFKKKELASFILNRGMNIFKIDHDELIFSNAIKAMNEKNKFFNINSFYNTI